MFPDATLCSFWADTGSTVCGDKCCPSGYTCKDYGYYKACVKSCETPPPRSLRPQIPKACPERVQTPP